MNILVDRKWPSGRCVQSEVFVNGEHECFGLEPPYEEAPIKPRAITAGTYQVIVRFSQKHHQNVPGVCDVPGFEDIEIHPGNFPHDTEGCLLVGKLRGVDLVSNSKVAFVPFFTKINNAIQAGEDVSITYVDSTQPLKTVA